MAELDLVHDPIHFLLGQHLGVHGVNADFRRHLPRDRGAIPGEQHHVLDSKTL